MKPTNIVGWELTCRSKTNLYTRKTNQSRDLLYYQDYKSSDAGVYTGEIGWFDIPLWHRFVGEAVPERNIGFHVQRYFSERY